jgi:hypothetical protein
MQVGQNVAAIDEEAGGRAIPRGCGVTRPRFVDGVGPYRTDGVQEGGVLPAWITVGDQAIGDDPAVLDVGRDLGRWNSGGDAQPQAEDDAAGVLGPR